MLFIQITNKHRQSDKHTDNSNSNNHDNPHSHLPKKHA